jgi:hypothetical protein
MIWKLRIAPTSSQHRFRFCGMPNQLGSVNYQPKHCVAELVLQRLGCLVQALIAADPPLAAFQDAGQLIGQQWLALAAQ